MLRLTLILCVGLFAALMIAGEDRGQLRPGLADAAARKALPAPDGPEIADSAPVVVKPAAKPESDTDVAAVKAAPAAPVVAEAAPKPYVEPQRELVTKVEEPVFSLATIGTETVPGSDVQPEALADGEGTIWYVVANSVNVRAEPSTDAEIVGRLGTGEATLVVQSVGTDWARIVIQGDGVEGFVALRYLSPEAP
jgi:uncharacterized protein YgiM (DUF1202 family)